MSIREDQDVEQLPDSIQSPDQATVTLTPDDATPNEEPEQQAKTERTRKPDGTWAKKKEVRQNAIKDNEEFRKSTSELGDLIRGMSEKSSRDIAALVTALRPQQQAQVAPEVTALEDQITQVSQLMKAELAKIAAGGDEAEYYKLDRKRLSLIARAEGAQAGWGKQPQQDSGLPPELAARLVQLHQEFPELAGHGKWNQVAKSLREGYLAAGHPDSLTTDRLAVQQAAQMLGLGQRAAPPSQRTRQAYGSPPTSGRNGTNKRSMTIPRNLIAGSGLTEAQIAEALFQEDD